MTPGRRGGLAAEHRRLARLPAARPAARRRSACRCFVDNDAKALALGEGWIGAAVGRAATTSPWSCRPASAAASCSTAGCSTARDGNAGHIGHIIVEPDGHLCRCGTRGCLEAEASGTAIAAITGRPAAEAGARGRSSGPARSSAGRWRRWPTLLDLRLAVVAGSVALGFGEPFFAAAQAEIDRRARLDFAVGCAIRPGGLGDRRPARRRGRRRLRAASRR